MLAQSELLVDGVDVELIAVRRIAGRRSHSAVPLCAEIGVGENAAGGLFPGGARALFERNDRRVDVEQQPVPNPTVVGASGSYNVTA